MRKSKKFLVTSLAATTLALVSFSDTMGVLPFSPQKVSAQEKDASKNGKIVKEEYKTCAEAGTKTCAEAGTKTRAEAGTKTRTKTHAEASTKTRTKTHAEAGTKTRAEAGTKTD